MVKSVSCCCVGGRRLFSNPVTHYAKPKKFQSFLNSIKSRRHPISPLKDNDALVSDDTDKATIFNRYFHSIFTAENCGDLSILHQSLTHHPDLIDSIDFTIEEVHAELSNLQRDKVCDPDHIPFLLATEWC